MCHRIEPLSLEEVEQALANLAHRGRATLHRSPSAAVQAYPGSPVPVIVADPGLRAAVMSWGFWGRRPTPTGRTDPSSDAPGAGKVVAASKLVFNTRLDTGARQLREGRGMWAKAMAHGRCLVPVRAFYEDGPAPVRTPYRFSLAGSPVFLLAGIAEDGRFSIVTTVPNAGVAPVHNRMPLALAPGESRLWLTGNLGDPAVLGRLADRGAVSLVAETTADRTASHPEKGVPPSAAKRGAPSPLESPK